MNQQERNQHSAKMLGKKLGLTFKLDWLAGRCPVQAEGKILVPQGEWHHIYFRARGQAWSMTIDVDEHKIWSDAKFYYKEPWPGDEFAAGWMTDNQAMECIERAIIKWKETL